MRVSYQHANPAAGNESFLLRFRSVGAETPCLLVDAGNGVDLDALTEPDDRLVGICLTHAHLDHYAELADAHRDGAPVFTSPATAAILGDVLDVAGTEYGVEQSTAVTESLTPVDGWTGVTDDVQIHPVPAGHAPGAVGWLVAVDDGPETHNLLATGDFTERRVAGFPGFPAAELPPVDALFLTASTNESFESSLTEAVGTAVEHAHGGARTLVTTSGLVGVHAAYLLSVVVDEYDLRVPIRVVGQVAKLYERLQYDMPGVETITHFEDPRTCLGHGVITIAGPEIPIERSSGRLFGVLRDDPNGSVLQLVGSGVDPVTDAGCTLHDYQLVNHPRRETLTAVHDAVDPIETVIVHAHGGAKEAFNDLDSVVWGTGDTTEYTLYDGTHWRLPPWMNGDRVFYSRERTSVAAYADGDLLGDVSVPTTRRHHDADLDAEGVDTDRLAELLHVAPASGTDASAASPDDPTADSGTTAGGAASPASAADSEASESSVRTDGAVDPASGSTAEDTREPEDTTMADDDDSPETPTDDSTLPDPSGPIRTTGAQPDAEPDELAREALADSDTTPEEFGARIEQHRSRVAAEREQTDADTAESADSDADQRGSAEPGDTSSGTDDGGEAGEDSDETGDAEEASEDSDETGDAGEASEVSAETDDGEQTSETPDGEASETEEPSEAVDETDETDEPPRANETTDDETDRVVGAEETAEAAAQQPSEAETDAEHSDDAPETADAVAEPAGQTATDSASDTVDQTDANETGRTPSATESGSVAPRESVTEGESVTERHAVEESTFRVSVSPLAVALARRAAVDTDGGVATASDADDSTATGSDTSADETRVGVGPTEEAVRTVVHSYLVALLGGRATGDESELLWFEVDTHPAVERVVAAAAESDERVDSPRQLFAAGLASALGADDPTTAVGGLDDYREQLDAVVENEAYAFESHGDVVEAAVVWALCES